MSNIATYFLTESCIHGMALLLRPSARHLARNIPANAGITCNEAVEVEDTIKRTKYVNKRIKELVQYRTL